MQCIASIKLTTLASWPLKPLCHTFKPMVNTQKTRLPGSLGNQKQKQAPSHIKFNYFKRQIVNKF